MKIVALQLFCLLVGLYTSVQAISGVVSELLARSWPTVPGEISAKGVISESGGSSRRTFSSKYFKVETQYTYEVDGQKYTGSRIRLDESPEKSREDAEALLAKYDRGTPVTVHYKSGEPGQAVIETGTRLSQWIRLIIGLGMTGYGAIAAIGIWQRFKSDDFSSSH